MIEIRNKQICIAGEPRIIMCGEIHYYRLDRKDWQDRIDKLIAAGCNAVASYVPWICHEPLEGEIDLAGTTRPELDLGGFIDLCHTNRLYFFVRPGPFIMAEMKNEGLPHWVYEKHPEIVPVSWDGRPATTKTVDYLAQGFLQEVRKWYEAVMAVVAPRLHTRGGNIIAVQLDNEMGMLSWVSNCPDLTDSLLDDFASWLGRRYEDESLKNRYPLRLDDPGVFRPAIRSPNESYAAQLRCDLGYYMRHRITRYAATLRAYAEESGVKDIPFVINIHGTGGGRGFTFPIGISQLYESYTQETGYISGSDIYFDDLTVPSFQDLYLINSFMDAVHNHDQPLSSVEFSCGSGDYGNNYGGRIDPSAVDFKTRMCIAQGHRLINYYLFSGGRNYRMDVDLHDGNDRIGFTGERHGFSAPISPEGELNYTFPRMASSIKTMMAVSDKIAVMKEERDSVSFAFIPDYYMTEVRYPGSDKMNRIVRHIESRRSHGAWENVARAMLLANFRFGSTDIQNKPIDTAATPVLVVASALYLHPHVQLKLVDYMKDGGAILLYGEVPLYDMEGRDCTILADAMGIRPAGLRCASEHYHLSLIADGWAAPRPEVRTHFAQVWETGEAEVFMRVYDTGEACGLDVKIGKGRAIVLTTEYNCDIDLIRKALYILGTKPALGHDCRNHGIFMTSTVKDGGERFLHILNLDGFDKEAHFYENGQELFEGRKILLQSKSGLMLPLHVCYQEVMILYSTAEITGVAQNAIDFRLTQPEDVIAVKTTRDIAASDDYEVRNAGDVKLIISLKHAKVDDRLKVRFQ